MADEPVTTADPSTQARAKKAWLVPVVVLAAGVGGAFVGNGVVAPMLTDNGAAGAAEADHGEGDTGDHGKKKKGGGHGGGEGGAGPLLRIENVVVNPAGSQGARFLMASIAFQVESEHQVEALRAQEVKLRDLIIEVLSAQTMDMLSAPDARDNLKHQLAAVIAPFLAPETHVEVFLPQLVIQ